MRLILSSCDFHNDQSRRRIFDNLGAAAENCRILFIPNEKATPEKLESGRYVGWLERWGFRRPHILVFDHRDPAAYAGLDLDALYIGGGNTFSQLARLRACGFDREVIRYARRGVTYIGGCAGAHIATKNVE